MIPKLALSAILLLSHLLDPLSEGNLPAESECLIVHVDLNGHTLSGPELLIFKTLKGEQSVPIVGGCFRVPAGVNQQEFVDVFFAIGRDRIYLSSISTNLLKARWDIELNDRRFNERFVLPKGVRAKNACAITFHIGEPETSSVMAPCRTHI